jgi:hypothetical protein
VVLARAGRPRDLLHSPSASGSAGSRRFEICSTKSSATTAGSDRVLFRPVFVKPVKDVSIVSVRRIGLKAPTFRAKHSPGRRVGSAAECDN